MAPFAGFEMPVHYELGVLKEHLHTRVSAGLFDVSHMGQVVLRPRDGKAETAARALETLVPADVLAIRPGRQRYTVFTNSSGGIVDDLIVANAGDSYVLIVNAARTDADCMLLKRELGNRCEVELAVENVVLALQGPQASRVLADLAPTTSAMRFMDCGHHDIDGIRCWVSRSGYTGEDGFELSVDVRFAEAVVERLLGNPLVRWIGLGARDSLRLEAGLCLYGTDIDEETTPVEAALEWSIQPSRRAGGARAGGFPGHAVILQQMQHGAPRRRVGLQAAARPVRGRTPLTLDDEARTAVGHVTSGGYGPSAESPVAMGYVSTAHATIGTRLLADVRGVPIPVDVRELPFIAHRYHR